MNYTEITTEAIMKAYNGGSKSITPNKIHPDYENQKDVDIWEGINKIAYKLQEDGFVKIVKTVQSKSIFVKSDDIKKIVFVEQNMADFAERYGQKEKKAFLKELEYMLLPYAESEHQSIATFAKEQLEIARSGKNPKYVQKQNATKLLNCLRAAVGMMNQTEDVMMREFSQDVFSDSKFVEDNAIKDHLFEIFGEDFQDADEMLKYYHIHRVPIMVYFKGDVKVYLKDGRVFKYKHSDGMMAIETSMVDEIDYLQTNKILTIENLTPFADPRHKNFDGLTVFLGGFSNNLNIRFLKKSNCEIMHSGDLDANGFRILHNLQKRVGRPVRSYLMAYDDAEKWYTYGKKMDDFNTKLLKKMYASDEYSPDEKKVFEYLMNKQVIIEQEKIVA